MIRLTELERQPRTAVVRVEGNLTGDGLVLLAGELRRYREAGCERVLLEADGLQLVSHRIHADVAWPEGLEVRFATSRPPLARLLAGYGLRVEPGS